MGNYGKLGTFWHTRCVLIKLNDSTMVTNKLRYFKVNFAPYGENRHDIYPKKHHFLHGHRT